MPKYLIDTNIFIEHLKGDMGATELLSSEKGLYVSYVSIGELMQGARNQRELSMITDLLTLFEHNLGSPKISNTAIKLLVKYQPKYGLQLLDALIAATALNMGAKLITLNIKDFSCIEGLEADTNI